MGLNDGAPGATFIKLLLKFGAGSKSYNEEGLKLDNKFCSIGEKEGRDKDEEEEEGEEEGPARR